MYIISWLKGDTHERHRLFLCLYMCLVVMAVTRLFFKCGKKSLKSPNGGRGENWARGLGAA